MSVLQISKPSTYLQIFQRMCSPNQSEAIFSSEDYTTPQKIKQSQICQLMDILRWDFQFSLWDEESSYGGVISTIKIHAGGACWLCWSTWSTEEAFGHWLGPFGCHRNRLIGKRGTEKSQTQTDRSMSWQTQQSELEGHVTWWEPWMPWNLLSEPAWVSHAQLFLLRGNKKLMITP